MKRFWLLVNEVMFVEGGDTPRGWLVGVIVLAFSVVTIGAFFPVAWILMRWFHYWFG